MGLIPKNRLQELKLLKRQAKAAKKRESGTRAKIVRFLIICEGTKTEPNYFRSLLTDRHSDVLMTDITGCGKSTCALVSEAYRIQHKLESQKQLTYDRVWIVFDKDDFEDFHNAIVSCSQYNFHPAWTNEAFELWFYLHFQYLDTAVSRNDYIEKIEREIRIRSGNQSFKYNKGEKHFYELLKTYGNENNAKLYASRLRELHSNKTNFNDHCPSTNIDTLITELENPEQILNNI